MADNKKLQELDGMNGVPLIDADIVHGVTQTGGQPTDKKITVKELSDHAETHVKANAAHASEQEDTDQAKLASVGKVQELIGAGRRVVPVTAWPQTPNTDIIYLALGGDSGSNFDPNNDSIGYVVAAGKSIRLYYDGEEWKQAVENVQGGGNVTVDTTIDPANPSVANVPTSKAVADYIGNLEIENKITSLSPQSGYVSKTDGSIASSESAKYIEISVVGVKSVRFLGLKAPASFSSGYAFIDSNNIATAHGWDYAATSVSKEYTVDVPTGAVSFRTTCESGELYFDNFYIYVKKDAESVVGYVSNSTKVVADTVNGISKGIIRNLIDGVTWENGRKLRNGNITSDSASGFKITSYIPVVPGTTIITNAKSKQAAGHNCIAFFTADKNAIANAAVLAPPSSYNDVITAIVPSDAKYVVLCIERYYNPIADNVFLVQVQSNMRECISYEMIKPFGKEKLFSASSISDRVPTPEELEGVNAAIADIYLDPSKLNYSGQPASLMYNAYYIFIGDRSGASSVFWCESLIHNGVVELWDGNTLHGYVVVRDAEKLLASGRGSSTSGKIYDVNMGVATNIALHPEIMRYKQHQGVPITGSPIHLPSTIYAPVGEHLQIFWRFISELKDPYSVDSYIKGPLGRNYSRYWDAIVTAGTKSLTVYHGSHIKSLSVVGITAPTNEALNGTGLNVLCCGASVTASSGSWVRELHRRLTSSTAESDVFGSPVGLGLQGVVFGGTNQLDTNVKCEATGGWRVGTFVNGSTTKRFRLSGITYLGSVSIGSVVYIKVSTTVYYQYHVVEVDTTANTLLIEQNTSGNTMPPTNTGDNVTNILDNGNASAAVLATYSTHGGVENKDPFNESDAGQERVFGFTKYINTNFGENESLDLMIWECGINDVFQRNVANALDDYRTIINKMHEQFPNCKIILSSLNGASPNNGMPYDYGADNPIATEHDCRMEMHKMHDGMQKLASEFSFVYYAPAGEMFDAENGYGVGTMDTNRRNNTQVSRDTSGVHPTRNGQRMLADGIFCATCKAINDIVDERAQSSPDANS